MDNSKSLTDSLLVAASRELTNRQPRECAQGLGSRSTGQREIGSFGNLDDRHGSLDTDFWKARNE